ncbi:hypothetical protein RHMOL_Rhmol07G0198300 [Rhododendron molle]|uniref:Uncharacterized protein n=1 Tax=Rhododendron molle TaxID=49168 RepID=A0ACC0N2W6_RHOML|nr:hypothetical protein RHMOL_Rhmol07G0198300 [Rhododendron molle]
MMRRHTHFEPVQIVVSINRPRILMPPIVWETINLIEEVEELQMQPWINPYEECDYSQWTEEEEEDLDFIYTDPYRTGESDFDEMEGEYDDPLDEISLASLFNQVTDLSCDCTVNKKEEEVMKAQADISIWDCSCLKEVATVQALKMDPVQRLCLVKKRVEKSIKLQKTKKMTLKCCSS